MSTTVFLADSFITSGTMLTLDNFGTGADFTQAGNRLSGQVSAKVGRVIVETRGSYSGLMDREYQISIQSTDTTGSFAGTLWQWSDTGGTTINAMGLTPVVDAWVPLSFAVEVRFRQAPVGPQFVAGDTIQFRAHCPHSVATLIDLIPNTNFLSGAVAVGMLAAIVVDLGTPRIPQACALLYHNLVANTPVQLWGSASNTFASHETFAMTYQADHMCSLPSVTTARRYWALVITVQSGQFPIQISEWYLGGKTALSLPWNIGFSVADERVAEPSAEVMRYGPAAAVPYSETYRLNFGPRRLATGEDAALLRALWRQLNQWQTQELRPVYVIPDDTTPNSFGLYHWRNNFEAQHIHLDHYGVPPELLSVIRSVA